MALGKRQRLDLDEMTGLVIKDPAIFRLEIVICPWQRFTREAGGGSGHAVLLKAFECYEEGDYQYRNRWISTCAEYHTAVDKAKEIARALVEMGCPKERIRIPGSYAARTRSQ